MAVTIGNLNSRVNVVDSNNMLSEAVMEQIVQQVMMKLRDEMAAAEQAKQEREITNRSTNPEPF